MPLPPKRKYPPVVLSGYIILEQDGKLLMMRRHNTGYQDGKYGLPSGHLEEKEFATVGTIREVAEEIGIVLKPKNIIISPYCPPCMQRPRQNRLFLQAY